MEPAPTQACSSQVQHSRQAPRTRNIPEKSATLGEDRFRTNDGGYPAISQLSSPNQFVGTEATSSAISGPKRSTSEEALGNACHERGPQSVMGNVTASPEKGRRFPCPHRPDRPTFLQGSVHDRGPHERTIPSDLTMIPYDPYGVGGTMRDVFAACQAFRRPNGQPG